MSDANSAHFPCNPNRGLDSNHPNLNSNVQIVPSKQTIEIYVDKENDPHAQNLACLS